MDDDGDGFDPAATRRGAGLTNLTDRIDALGGRLEIESTPGRATHVRGSVPLPVAAVFERVDAPPAEAHAGVVVN